MTSKDFEKIAFLKLCCPGDLLFTTPTVRAVRRKYPDARLYYITGGYSSFIPEHNSDIDEVLLLRPPYESRSRLQYIRELIRGIAAIRNERFDLIINFHRSGSAALAAKLGGARKVCGFSSSRLFVDISTEFDSRIHETIRYLNLARLLGCATDDLSLEYETAADEDRGALELLGKAGIEDKFVIIAPGGGENPGTKMHTKRWPAYYFKSVSEYIKRKYGIPVVTVGSQREVSLAESIQPSINLAGKTSLPVLASLLKLSILVIANDSGPLYLASAVGAKTIGIYGPSSEKLVAPMVTGHISLKSEVICRPCYLPEQVQRGTIYCPSGNWACMLTISPDKVCAAVDALLEGHPERSGKDMMRES